MKALIIIVCIAVLATTVMADECPDGQCGTPPVCDYLYAPLEDITTYELAVVVWYLNTPLEVPPESVRRHFVSICY